MSTHFIPSGIGCRSQAHGSRVGRHGGCGGDRRRDWCGQRPRTEAVVEASASGRTLSLHQRQLTRRVEHPSALAINTRRAIAILPRAADVGPGTTIARMRRLRCTRGGVQLVRRRTAATSGNGRAGSAVRAGATSLKETQKYKS